MQHKKRKKLDDTGIGLLSGFLLPLIIFFVVYLVGENDIPFSDYIKNMWRLHALVKLGSLCVFANVVIFMGFIRKEYYRAARGVLGITLIYAFIVLGSRVF